MMHPDAPIVLPPGAAKPAAVDLTRALRDGLITRQEYVDTIERCTACDDTVGCTRWIAAQAMTNGADIGPGLCRNGPLLAELGRL